MSHYGQGTVREKSPGHWELRWPAKDPITDRAIQRSKMVKAKSRRDALRFLAQAREAEFATSEVTVAELVDRWITHTSPSKTRRTIREQRTVLRLHIAPNIGHIKARDLSARQLDELYAKLSKTKATQTVRHVHNALHAAYKAGIRWGWLVVNPVDRAEPPPVRSKRIVLPLAVELNRIFEQCNPTMQVFARLAIVTGARRGELCGLQWRDIDANRKTITIRQSISQPGGRPIVKEPKSGDTRRVAIDDLTLAMLHEHALRLEAVGQTAAGLDGFVFPSTRSETGSQPILPTSVTQWWRQACTKAGVHARLHDLRHASASYLLAQGVPVLRVSSRLGHSRPSTTSDIYGHQIGDAGAEDAETLARALLPGTP